MHVRSEVGPRSPDLRVLRPVAAALQGKPDKRFVQSFFLATQDSGFFVLNDVFAFLPQPSPQQQQQQPQGLTSAGLSGLGSGPTENGYSGVEHGLGGFAGVSSVVGTKLGAALLGHVPRMGTRQHSVEARL